MIRGTTPVLVFELPLEAELLAAAWVTLAQHGKVVLNKELEECTCEGSLLSVRLTQEETLQLEQNCNTRIQLRVRTQDGEVLASRIREVNTAQILKDGVI